MQLNFPDIDLKLAEWIWKKEVRVRTVGLCSGFFLSMLLMRLLLQLQWTNFEDYYFSKNCTSNYELSASTTMLYAYELLMLKQIIYF